MHHGAHYGDGQDDEAKRVYDHMRQSNEAAKHQVGRMIQEVGEDHLVALGYLLGGISAGGGKSLATYFHGVVVASLESRFNICAACGANHDEKLKEMTTCPGGSQCKCPRGENGQLACESARGASPDAQSLEEESSKFLEFFLGGSIPQAAPGSTEPPAEVPDLKIGETGMLSPQQIEQMAAYGLDDLRDEDTNALVGFICLNCKTHVQTIEDRMREVPGVAGCSGCIQKEKWG